MGNISENPFLEKTTIVLSNCILSDVGGGGGWEGWILYEFIESKPWAGIPSDLHCIAGGPNRVG
jgi:hypothetical protein